MKNYLKNLVLLFLLLVRVAGAQSGNLQPNDFENSAKEQLVSLKETVSSLTNEKGDLSDRRGDLTLRILKEYLNDKADEATSQKNTQGAAYYQKESLDLQSLHDDIYAHSIKIRDLNHQMENLRVGLYTEVIDRFTQSFENDKNSKAVSILKECKGFLEKAQSIVEKKFELAQNATEVKKNGNFQTVPDIRKQIDELQKQYDKLISDTQVKMKQIGLDKNNPLLNI